MTATEARDGVLVPVGCPNCYSPTKGANRMRHVEAMDAADMAETWRRSILECEHCGHGVLVEVTLAPIYGPGAP